MGSNRKTLVEMKADAPAFSSEERKRLDAMTQDEIDRTAESDPENPPMSDEALEKAVFAREVRRTREALGLTQPLFAEKFHIALSRLRDWERGRYRPDSVAAAYIKTIRHDPQAVIGALAVKSG